MSHESHKSHESHWNKILRNVSDGACIVLVAKNGHALQGGPEKRDGQPRERRRVADVGKRALQGRAQPTEGQKTVFQAPSGRQRERLLSPLQGLKSLGRAARGFRLPLTRLRSPTATTYRA